jgi:hypothetical protein
MFGTVPLQINFWLNTSHWIYFDFQFFDLSIYLLSLQNYRQRSTFLGEYFIYVGNDLKPVYVSVFMIVSKLFKYN